MYLTIDIIERSIGELKRLHPFFGITFLACKKGHLPIGGVKHFPIGGEEECILRTYYKPDLRSKCYFHPFKTSGSKNGWVEPKYPYAGSQSTRTRGPLATAFDHQLQTNEWGWKPNYVTVLKKQLQKDKSHHIPTFWLAAWLYRLERWPKNSESDSLISRFLKDFDVTRDEQDALFEMGLPKGVERQPFQAHPCVEQEILDLLPAAPDAQPEHGGALRLLDLQGIGPTKSLSFEPADRLTMVTGDNGLGKTFLLECAWWSLTGDWADQPAAPRADAKKAEPKITFEITGKGAPEKRKTIVTYDWEKKSWPWPKGRPTIPGLIVYARVDGSFAVWDPARHIQQFQSIRPERALVISRDEALDGKKGQIEGLIRDWVKWQYSPDQKIFETFKRLLARLSPPEGPPLNPAMPMRIPSDPREIPTIQHSYGNVPFYHESAGIRRIVTLGYLLLWAWSEHLVSTALAKIIPEKKIVILIDEMEAHLHPKWQREILPAILDLSTILETDINAQIIVTTHSPLVLASVESRFQGDTDKLYHLHISREGEVTFAEMPFIGYGKFDDWLTSDIFELKQARSREGEEAVERAKALLGQQDPSGEELLEATGALKANLPPQDIFWARWAYFLERKGIKL